MLVHLRCSMCLNVCGPPWRPTHIEVISIHIEVISIRCVKAHHAPFPSATLSPAPNANQRTTECFARRPSCRGRCGDWHKVDFGRTIDYCDRLRGIASSDRSDPWWTSPSADRGIRRWCGGGHRRHQSGSRRLAVRIGGRRYSSQFGEGAGPPHVGEGQVGSPPVAPRLGDIASEPVWGRPSAGPTTTVCAAAAGPLPTDGRTLQTITIRTDNAELVTGTSRWNSMAQD